MLPHFDTGYEGKYDFPLHPAAPAVPYMLASVPRTGSTFLSHLMWRSGCLGAPLEYLNFTPAGPYGFANSSHENQVDLWRSVLRRRVSPNGVFGVKCFPVQLQELQEAHPALVAEVFATMFPQGGQARVVQLARRDRVAHRVSYARAILSGVWRSDQERGDAGESPEYSEDALALAEKLIASQSQAWDQMFAEMRITPLLLWYEDVVAAPQAALEQVAAYLGVTLDPAAQVTVPEVKKQREGNAGEWVRRHGEESA